MLWLIWAKLHGKKTLVQQLSKSSKIIVITGAESTGKSTLAEALANHFKVPFVPEYAREYILNLKEKYTYYDVEYIARKQIEQLNELQGSNSPIIILDTWLLITKVWFDVVYSSVPDWLNNKINNTFIDLFLVCDIDLPWADDMVRENGGETRNLLQKRYIEEIKNLNFKYKIISGEGDIRESRAIQHIADLEKKLTE